MLPRDVYTFSPGPSILPLELLKDIKGKIASDKSSVLEMSSDSGEFRALVQSNKDLLRQIVKVPDDYEIFFTQGGASYQFSTIPINFLSKPEDVGLYLVTGNWSESALKEAQKYGKAVQVNDKLKKGEVYSQAIQPDASRIDKSAKYLYYCDNETCLLYTSPSPRDS